MSFISDLIEIIKGYWIEISCGSFVLVASITGVIVYRRSHNNQQNSAVVNVEENKKNEETKEEENKSSEGLFEQSRKAVDPIVDNFWVTHGVYLVTIIVGIITGILKAKENSKLWALFPAGIFVVSKIIVILLATYWKKVNSLKINFAKSFDYQALMATGWKMITLRVVEFILLAYSLLYSLTGTWIIIG